MKKERKYFGAALLLVISTLLCIYGFTYARYVTNYVWDYYLKAQGFYFTSDYLKINSCQNTNTLWEGESIYFNVKNYYNPSLVTATELEYTINCTIKGEAGKHTKCEFKDSKSDVTEVIWSPVFSCFNKTDDGKDVSAYDEETCLNGGYEWENELLINDHYFDIILTNEEYELEDLEVNIMVTTTKPYQKVITGDFKLHKRDLKEEAITMIYNSYANYDYVLITNSYLNDKDITLEWDASLLRIDASNYSFLDFEVDDNDYINKIKINLKSKESRGFVFYRTDLEAIYNEESFTLTEGENN